MHSTIHLLEAEKKFKLHSCSKSLVLLAFIGTSTYAVLLHTDTQTSRLNLLPQKPALLSLIQTNFT